MSEQQRRTDPRWTPQGVPEQPHYRSTAPGWGQVRHTPRSTTEIAHGVIHTIEHSTLLQMVRSSRALPALDGGPRARPGERDWAEDAARLAALVDGSIRNLLPVTGNPTIARLRGYLADLRSRLLARDPAGIHGAVQSITAALSAPAASLGPGKPNSAGDISSLDALAQAAARLLHRAGYPPSSEANRPTNPRIREFRGE
ncbi:MAG TPA: hypothetical protein VKA84_23690 [Gemmatimonadaceae bacterium]|nr:hypothetical protein [Gemmatimonadaceae bacterium]